MTRKEWEYLGFGFGAAVVLGFATWGAIELGKKVAKKAREDGWFQREDADEEAEGEDGDGDEDESFVDKSINSRDEIVAQEFERNIEILDN